MLRPLFIFLGLVGVALLIFGAFRQGAVKPYGTLLPATSVVSGVSAAALESGAGAGGPISPLPRSLDLDPRRVEVGELLFNDRRLSGDNSVSCRDCHNLETGGVDRRVRSPGAGGNTSPLNTTTVFNVGLLPRLLWSGRFESLEAQLEALLTSSPLLDTGWEEILGKLRADAELVEAFRGAFHGEGPTERTVLAALSLYQRSLLTPNSPFDRYLRGEESALSPAAFAGYRKFSSFGCISCHQGMHVGANLFQRFGVIRNYHSDEQIASPDFPEAYFGLYAATGNEDDRFMFRVSGLRNVAETPPYFHDGSAETLEEAVRTMATYQLGRALGDEDVGDIVAFLESLTGEAPGAGAPVAR
ncbi:MAG: cytochrome c peroxidase [Acidobacteriota bacterium]